MVILAVIALVVVGLVIAGVLAYGLWKRLAALGHEVARAADRIAAANAALEPELARLQEALPADEDR